MLMLQETTAPRPFRQSLSDRPHRLVSLLLMLLMVLPGSLLHAQSSSEAPLWGRGGFVPVFGGLGQTAGITAGLRYDVFLRHPNYTLSADAVGSLRGYGGFRGVAGFENDYVALYGYARYRYLPKEVFYGFGSESDEDAGGDYRIDDRLAGISAAFKPAELFATGMHLSLLDNRFGRGRDSDRPPVSELHDVRAVDSRYMILGFWLELDGREFVRPRRTGYSFAPVEPEMRGLDLGVSRGWYVSAEVSPHIATHDDVADFLRIDLEGQAFIPTGLGSDGFALRSRLSMTGSSDGGAPFYLLPALGGSRSIRGFNPARFRDDNALLFNLEYRRSVLLFLDAAAFVDAGQTFSAGSEISLSGMEFGYGVGLRARVGRVVLGRVDVAHSREGFGLYLRAGTFL